MVWVETTTQPWHGYRVASPILIDIMQEPLLQVLIETTPIGIPQVGYQD
jgi:hypothetical protein